jgi:hypothetical protein
MGSYTITRAKDDGTFDLVEIDLKTNQETIVGNVSNAQYPNGQESNDEVAERNRMFRNDRLTETDWWANSDVTMTEAQRTYRQALRDLTSHANWPNLNDSDWPTKP